MIDDLIQTGFIIRTAKLHRWMHANFRAKKSKSTSIHHISEGGRLDTSFETIAKNMPCYMFEWNVYGFKILLYNILLFHKKRTKGMLLSNQNITPKVIISSHMRKKSKTMHLRSITSVENVKKCTNVFRSSRCVYHTPLHCNLKVKTIFFALLLFCILPFVY